MSVQTPSISIRTPRVEVPRLVWRAKLLAWLSVAWMTIEAGVATIAALVAGSVALLGFGLDSLIELASAGIVIWRFTGQRAHGEAAERRAQQLIAACFAALAAYLAVDGIRVLLTGSQPHVSWPGAAVSAGALIFMPLLSRSKRNIARELDSAATAGDAAQSRLCAIAAAGVLVSIVANAALHWWRLDPAIGLAIATLAIHEARQAWAGNVCGNCAPATLACRTSPDSDYCEKSAA